MCMCICWLRIYHCDRRAHGGGWAHLFQLVCHNGLIKASQFAYFTFIKACEFA